MTTYSPQTLATLEAVDALIASRSILAHPFYQAWQAGTLTRDQLGVYAQSYYPHVAAFPGYLEAAIATTSDPEIRTELLDNLSEERAVPAPHDRLWLDFARGMGVERDSIEGTPASEATAVVVARFRALCDRSTASALAALYAYESQQPAVAREKEAGLRALYGVTEDATCAYFAVHAEADVRHREGERNALAHCLDAGQTDAGEVLAATGEALDAYWLLLDGVCRETGIPVDGSMVC